MDETSYGNPCKSRFESGRRSPSSDQGSGWVKADHDGRELATPR
jgi:hypothetical protein